VRLLSVVGRRRNETDRVPGRGRGRFQEPAQVLEQDGDLAVVLLDLAREVGVGC
jgi:hypothetical protein